MGERGCPQERWSAHGAALMPSIPRASLWSSCVVLPLLALTWMSAVLAVTDRRSALFQILFAVFDSLEGFVIVMVHCILRREVGVLGLRSTCPSWWTCAHHMARVAEDGPLLKKIAYFPRYRIIYGRSAADRAE